MEFDPNRALAYARALARPRLAGSGEDARVAAALAERLIAFGYVVEREPFRYTRAFDIALSAEIGLALALVSAGLTLPGWRPASGLAILLLLASVGWLNRRLQQAALRPDGEGGAPAPWPPWSRRFRTANIVARPTPPAEPDGPQLYLMAHLDSKSQRMPVILRVVLILGFLIGLSVFSLAVLVVFPGQAFVVTGAGGLALVCGLPLLGLDVGNESPGAIDNASGAGLVLHLAELLQTRPDLLKSLHLTILINSAEEMATMGSLFHVRRRLADLRRAAGEEHLYVLNFDGIGTDGQLYLAGGNGQHGGLRDRLAKAARELRIPLGRFRPPGVLFDHVPFAQHGLDAASLLTIGRATWAVHTSRDTADKLDPGGFERAGRLALAVIEELAR